MDDTDEMDLSDTDMDQHSSAKKARIEKPKKKVRKYHLLVDEEFKPYFFQNETNSQRNFLDAKAEDLMDPRSDPEIRNKQIKVLQETIRNLQRKLIETNAKETQNETKISELEESIRESNVKELLLRTKIANARTFSQSITNDEASEQSVAASVNNHGSSSSTEPQLISFATAYLVIHPNGAEFDAILNYVEQFLSNTDANELQEVFLKNEKLFSVDESGKKWFFAGFNQNSLKC